MAAMFLPVRQWEVDAWARDFGRAHELGGYRRGYKAARHSTRKGWGIFLTGLGLLPGLAIASQAPGQERAILFGVVGVMVALGLTSAQQEHAVVLNGIAELRRQVEQVLAILAKEDDASPAAWFWLTMTDQERDEKFSELSDWVETCSAPSTPTTSPTRSDRAGRTIPKLGGSWPGSTSSGPSPTWPDGQRYETSQTGTTAGPQA